MILVMSNTKSICWYVICSLTVPINGLLIIILYKYYYKRLILIIIIIITRPTVFPVCKTVFTWTLFKIGRTPQACGLRYQPLFINLLVSVYPLGCFEICDLLCIVIVMKQKSLKNLLWSFHSAKQYLPCLHKPWNIKGWNKMLMFVGLFVWFCSIYIW